MKKWTKRAVYSGICLIPVGVVIGFATDWSNSISISCVGSSGVKPFVEFFASNYYHSPEGKNYNVTVEAGGSGFGIGQIAEGYAAIGNSSKDPYSTVMKSHEQQWIDQNIKTVTIAWEAICIVYIPPRGISNYDNLNLDINQDNIDNFYRAFSGHLENYTNRDGDPLGFREVPTIYDFLSENSINNIVPAKNLSENDLAICKNTPLKPYVRGGGSNTSGTAGAFFTESGFDNSTGGDHLIKPFNLTGDQVDAFTVGRYDHVVESSDRPGYQLFETDEANSRAWDMFTKNNHEGSLVYLSSGFVQTNRPLIDNAHYMIANYAGVEYVIDTQDPSNTTVTNGYNWFRPLNSMLNVVENDGQYITLKQYQDAWTPAMTFVAWMFFNWRGTPFLGDGNYGFADLYLNGLAGIGGIPLTQQQFMSMTLHGHTPSQIPPQDPNPYITDSLSFWNEFWVSDMNLLHDLDSWRNETIPGMDRFGAIHN